MISDPFQAIYDQKVVGLCSFYSPKAIYLQHYYPIEVSFKGRTSDFGSDNSGSSPLTSTNQTKQYNNGIHYPDGMAVVDTTWFKVSVWDAKEQFAQGQWVSLTGRLRQRRYIDSANNERIMYDVVAQEIHTLKVEQNETL